MDAQTFKEHLAVLAAFPEQLRRQIAGLDAEALLFRPGPNEWSITEVVGHLIDIDVLMRARIGKIISIDNPPLQTIDIDGTVRERDYQHKQATFLLHSLTEHRAEFIEQIRYLRPEALDRTGQHPTRGPISAAEFIAMVVRHDVTHTEQIANNLKAFRGE
jgi:uncharacterized damage-inducible protein DinB